MKKILVFLLSVVLAFMGCSTDDEVFNGTLTGGLYAYYGDEYAIAIGTTYKDSWSFDTGCEPGYITITDLSTSEYVFSQTQEIITHIVENRDNKAVYKGWGYKNGLSILCIPKSANSFVGKILKNTSGLILPDEMEFTRIK